MSLCPVILAGGSGTRLWPLSRKHYPKQFISLFGDLTMIQQTMLRINRDIHEFEILPTQVICNEEHRFTVLEQARAISHPLQAVVLEPVGRNTAPALTISALEQIREHEDVVLLMMPADHIVKSQHVFQQCIAQAYREAQQDVLVTFGIKPDRAESGYGYIECAGSNDKVQELVSFTEKPPQSVAKKYLESGRYLWNSGIFMVKASVWLQLIEQANPEILRSCSQAFEAGTLDGDFFRLDAGMFESCPADSIDYAVMEHINSSSQFSARVVPLDAGWSDIGSWYSVWQESEKDSAGNLIDGDVLVSDSSNTLVKSGKRLISLLGVKDLLVVDTPDALLIANKNSAQDVKKLVEILTDNSRSEYETHSCVYRPWGSYEILESGATFQVKRIVVSPGRSLSLQLHHRRSEHWVVVEGLASITIDESEFELQANESTYIPIEAKHRLQNRTSEPLTIIEVQVGDYLGEDDIERFDDEFGRT